ncbi:MAG: ABC transporter ATP-binding protein [Planctomycetota bacterium]|nr:MAG: ABC transporter ATP-binding protein [Planctomycetota bacterium]
MSTVLEVAGITRTFGAYTAVDDVSFKVGRGEVCGFIGPNGAGKTTTMRICATLDLPDRGDVRVDGMSVIEHPREVRRRVGFMPDAFGAYPNTSVWEFLDFFARAYELKGEARTRRVAEVVEFTGLGPLLDKEVRALSKGMRQRLCLGKTLLHDPSVLILDEPAAGLDPRARIELRELLKVLGSMGKCVLVSSHILSELAEMCTAIVVIERGRLRAAGDVSEIARDFARGESATEVIEVEVRALGPSETLLKAVHELPNVASARQEGELVVFAFQGSVDGLPGVLEELMRRGIRVVSFAPRQARLEDLFLRITAGEVQ